MAFVVVLILLIVAIVAVMIGTIASSTPAFMIGALFSAAAIVILWRQTSTSRDQTFVTNAPERSVPQWDTKLQSDSTQTPNDYVVDIAAVQLAIEDYDSMLAAEILRSLDTLSAEQLEAVVRHESVGKAHVAVLNRARTLIDLTKETEREEPSISPTPIAPATALSVEAEPGAEAVTKRRPARETPKRAAARPSESKGPRTPRKTTESKTAETKTAQTKQRKGPDLSL